MQIVLFLSLFVTTAAVGDTVQCGSVRYWGFDDQKLGGEKNTVTTRPVFLFNSSLILGYLNTGRS